MTLCTKKIFLPVQYAVKGKIFNNLIEQVIHPGSYEIAQIDRYSRRGVEGYTIQKTSGDSIVAVSRKIQLPPDTDALLVYQQGSLVDDVECFKDGTYTAFWQHPKILNIKTQDQTFWLERCNSIRNSWKNQFFFKEESVDGLAKGLRPAQIGALYSILAHWKVTENPATIVMPTGTGKTETMLALLIHEHLPRLLVVVPTDALREQIFRKFKTLGILKELGIVGELSQYPIVCSLKKRPLSPDQVNDIFQRCNVIVSTMSVVNGCSKNVCEKMAELSSHLFIDEAHHIPAPSWNTFRGYFKNKPVIQFTATPFRTDGKHVDGKVIFNYPLRKAQAEGYFKPINFKSINEFSPENADKEIALNAIKQLKTDLDLGLDHIIMARTENIIRAEKVYEIYKEIAGDYDPLIIHSKLPAREKQNALQKLIQRETRIVVCVQMLGEGFDLPELKIAALHDVHKTLAITLQFTGRFTRAKENIGDATVVANIAASGVEDCLRDLYAEDADWNVILRFLSEGASNKQARKSDFINEFRNVPENIPLQNIFPKMSTVVYQTHCARWDPDKVCAKLKESIIFTEPTINAKHNVVLFITREIEPVPWGVIREVQNITWHLYLLHWRKDQNLLFINSSNNASAHQELASAVAGNNVELIHGEQIFRCLNGINYLILMNLGLNHAISRAMRFTMYMGSDIASALRDPELQNKIKCNLFGKGYEAGQKTSIGCSRKGRIWSYKIAYDMAEWVEWCSDIGAKLINNKIPTESIFSNIILPERIKERPMLVPLTIEWPDEFLAREDYLIKINIEGEVVPFYESGLELTEHKKNGQLRFRVSTINNNAEYEIKFENDQVIYHCVSEKSVDVIIGRKSIPLTDVFQENWPIIRFENNGFLNYDELCIPPRSNARIPYDRNSIEAWDWNGTDIKKESQTHLKYTDSIQFKVIENLKASGKFEVIFNDDETNEIADIIGMLIEDDKFVVHLFHCKFSNSYTPGARVEDLYAVCGQAQRSVYWKGDIEKMFNRIRMREDSWKHRYNLSRFEKGNLKTLAKIFRKVSTLIPEFKIYIVQPGLSKSLATNNQLELLAATDMYLQETYAIRLGVIASV